MSFHARGAGAPVDESCHYGTSRLECRGPQRSLAAPYIAVLGSCESYGRFVDVPFADLVERRVGQTVVNLGAVTAGIDTFLRDQVILKIAQDADRVVIQAMKPEHLSNRLYRVHPRRNDRFLAPSELLRKLYPDVDFTNIHYTGDLLRLLLQHSPDRFDVVRAELRKAWMARMRTLLGHFPGRGMVLWARYRNPLVGPADVRVDEDMIDSLDDCCVGVIRVTVESAQDAGDFDTFTIGAMPVPAAAYLIGATGHQAIADKLTRVLAPARLSVLTAKSA
ncbi:DUF6473 family protein [Chachezhania sediminis]|uniref:DUF6473 family protein n=1 Tax=Chachezhania sediminis TaxID=2599291 RepID=UPI00131DCB32|nr:DUF6473 family protein [Chachezhania sediminis]